MVAKLIGQSSLYITVSQLAKNILSNKKGNPYWIAFGVLLSCRESNPGPNKIAKRFLHAYFMIRCRE